MRSSIDITLGNDVSYAFFIGPVDVIVEELGYGGDGR